MDRGYYQIERVADNYLGQGLQLKQNPVVLDMENVCERAWRSKQSMLCLAQLNLYLIWRGGSGEVLLLTLELINSVRMIGQRSPGVVLSHVSSHAVPGACHCTQLFIWALQI